MAGCRGETHFGMSSPRGLQRTAAPTQTLLARPLDAAVSRLEVDADRRARTARTRQTADNWLAEFLSAGPSAEAAARRKGIADCNDE